MTKAKKEIQLQKDGIRKWLGVHSERVAIIAISLAILLSIGFGLILKDRPEETQDSDRKVMPHKVKIQTEAEGSAGQKPVKTSFFLEPSPGEVLSMITELGGAELPAVNQKYSGLKVMWPLYYFGIQEQQAGQATLILDVDENGFGVGVSTTVDLGRYPQFLEMEHGKKIWLAGEITNVDMSGTGTIVMAVEHVSFKEDLMDAVVIKRLEKEK